MRLRRKYIGFTLLGILFLILIFLVNLIWFRPLFIKHFFYKELLTGLSYDPQSATKVKAPYFYGKYKGDLNDLSIESLNKQEEQLKKAVRRISSYNERFLSQNNSISKKIIQWHLQKDLEGMAFKNHGYLINPYKGEQNSLPSYLDTYHYVESESDADAYIERLASFGDYFSKIIDRMEAGKSVGIIPPKHILETSVLQAEKFIAGYPENNMLYTTFANKINSCEEITNKDEYLELVKKEIEETVVPAYINIINYCRTLSREADNRVGVWKLPDGDRYYNHLLKHHTTLDLDANDVHEIGKQEMGRVRKELIAAFNELGYECDESKLMEVLVNFSKEERFILGNSIEGREKCLLKYDSILNNAEKHVKEWFVEFPESELEIKRVPEFKQEGSSRAYYEVPTMDGNGKGSFYVRLDILDVTPSYEMPTLAYHEGIPGHHFQLAYHLEKESIPIYRKRFFNNAYIEGWALYAERLMYDQGMYDNDPYGNIGRLSAELVRTVRLIVDTGLHSKKWTREEAVQYMKHHTGMAESKVRSEINRYIVDPGQACSYYIGYMKFRELKERAIKELGNDFELKAFHSVLLSEGMVPLQVLEELVDSYIETLKSGSEANS